MANKSWLETKDFHRSIHLIKTYSYNRQTKIFLNITYNFMNLTDNIHNIISHIISWYRVPAKICSDSPANILICQLQSVPRTVPPSSCNSSWKKKSCYFNRTTSTLPTSIHFSNHFTTLVNFNKDLILIRNNSPSRTVSKPTSTYSNVNKIKRQKCTGYKLTLITL